MLTAPRKLRAACSLHKLVIDRACDSVHALLPACAKADEKFYRSFIVGVYAGLQETVGAQFHGAIKRISTMALLEIRGPDRRDRERTASGARPGGPRKSEVERELDPCCRRTASQQGGL